MTLLLVLQCLLAHLKILDAAVMNSTKEEVAPFLRSVEAYLKAAGTTGNSDRSIHLRPVYC